MPTLHIKRSREYANRIRKINLVIDGQPHGSILNGETKSFQLEEGFHTIQAKIDWCTSNQLPVFLGPSQSLTVGLSSFAKSNPLKLLLALYYVTLGTKKYLKLEEVHED